MSPPPPAATTAPPAADDKAGHDVDKEDVDVEDLESPHPDPHAHSDDSGNELPKEKQAEDASSQGLRRRVSRTESSLRRFRSLTRDKSYGDLGNFSHPLSHQQTSPDVLVHFEGDDDLYNPINWPLRKKIMTTALYGFTTMGSTLASSIFSPGTGAIAREFGVSTEVVTVGTALLLFGFGAGPLIWGPLSELYGRKISVLTPYFVAAIFLIGTATAKDIQTILITRFFAGFFGSAPVTNTGGVLGDIWTAESRGVAIVCYALAVTAGPTLGPIIGGALVQSHLGWRWTEYLTAIYMFFVLAIDVIFLEESHGPTLLKYKAAQLRVTTRNWALHAQHEEWNPSFKDLAEKYLVRPFAILFSPIGINMCAYASFVYAIFYAQLAAFPIIFQDIRGFGQVTGQLPFLAILIGILCGAVINIVNNKYYARAFRKAGNRPVPERRLPPMMAGGIMFAGGLYLFSWTCEPPSIPWPVPCVGLLMVGCSFFLIFQAVLNYLVDTFQSKGASAIAGNTFLRSALGGAFPLFIMPMYGALGPRVGGTIFAAVGTLLIPIPFLFFTFGKRIRAAGAWSKESVY